MMPDNDDNQVMPMHLSKEVQDLMRGTLDHIWALLKEMPTPVHAAMITSILQARLKEEYGVELVHMEKVDLGEFKHDA